MTEFWLWLAAKMMNRRINLKKTTAANAARISLGMFTAVRFAFRSALP